MIWYIVPCHNEEKILPEVVDRIRKDPREKECKFIFIENGSRDQTWRVIQDICKKNSEQFFGLTIQQAGMGYAYHAGLQKFLQLAQDGDHALLTAADFPFDWSDFDSFKKISGAFDVAIGSKAHPKSVIRRSALRRMMSLTYQALRWIIVGMRTKDSQGTVLLSKRVCVKVLPKIAAVDFFFSTELVAIAEHQKMKVVEVPIVYLPTERPSSVRIFKSSTAMVRQLLQLRARLRG